MDMNNRIAREQTKSKERVRDHGEVFTAEREVKAMCDLVKDETERIDSRFLEPDAKARRCAKKVRQKPFRLRKKRRTCGKQHLRRGYFD